LENLEERGHLLDLGVENIKTDLEERGWEDRDQWGEGGLL
jgi:hypothetical protein